MFLILTFYKMSQVSSLDSILLEYKPNEHKTPNFHHMKHQTLFITKLKSIYEKIIFRRIQWSAYRKQKDSSERIWMKKRTRKKIWRTLLFVHGRMRGLESAFAVSPVPVFFTSLPAARSAASFPAARALAFAAARTGLGSRSRGWKIDISVFRIN